MSRYVRQEKLFGSEGQKKLSDASVTIVGCGGLGTYVSLLLATAGVGGIRLVDGGSPAESDLNRQFFYSGEEGFKAEILSKKLKRINPRIEIDTVCEFVDESNVSDAIGECDVIADCLDTIASRLVLNKYALSKNIPLAHGGVDGFYGQATFMIPGSTPCLNCILRGSDGHVPDSFAPVVSMIGSLQASDIMKYITGSGETLAGKLFTMYAGTNEFDVIGIRPDKGCPFCDRSNPSR